MVNAWLACTLAAAVAGVVGFFTVLRGSAFAGHAIPSGSFAGAAAANLAGVSGILGLGAFSLLSAGSIAWLRRRGRSDAVTALVLVTMLGTGSLLLSFGEDYATQVYSLLFGDVFGVDSAQLSEIAGLALACAVAMAALYRPLLLSSVLDEVGEARGIGRFRAELAFLIVLALATTLTVPVVGTLLVFSLMVGPPAAAGAMSTRPASALALSVALSLLTIWVSLAAAYALGLPVGFFVGGISALVFASGRGWAARERRSDGVGT